MRRRDFLHGTAAATLLGASACATGAAPAKARVVVVGGGYGGATTAKYLRLLSQHRIEVVLIEPNEVFVSCPVSNLVIGGNRKLADITMPYTGLVRHHGITMVRDRVTAIDAERKQVRLQRGDPIRYDKLVVSPGVELMFDRIEGLAEAHASGRILQAWHAGAETLALRRQLEAMPDGGVYAIAIPEEPFRCPPAPYERACQVAWYFKQAKPRSKVIIVDANPDVISKGPLFKRAWAELYPGMIEYRPQSMLAGVDAAQGVLHFQIQDDVKADVINALPPMRAGRVAVDAGLANMAGGHWCGVNYLNFESTVAKDVHVLGDAIQTAPGMSKSGHMANGEGKVAAAAIVAELAGWPVDPAPMLTNTCYSFVDDRHAMHIAGVLAWNAAQKTWGPVEGAGGLSDAPNEEEGRLAASWARNIWADTLS